MASTAKCGPQDLPPEGGYSPIQTSRIKLRTLIGGKLTIGAFVASTSFGLYMYYLTAKQIKREELEMRSAKFVLIPLLLAERDREYLKNIRHNRDHERELMKNYDGWKVGTYFGESIYKTVPKDEWIDQTFSEYFIHSPDESFVERLRRKHFH